MKLLFSVREKKKDHVRALEQGVIAESSSIHVCVTTQQQNHRSQSHHAFIAEYKNSLFFSG